MPATLHEWLTLDPEPRIAEAAHAVAHAALKAGQLSLTGDHDPAMRCRTDVLGPVLTEMRSAGARNGLGEFHTPVDVADMMAALLLSNGDPAWFRSRELTAVVRGM